MTDNGQQPDTVELPRELVQAILDTLGRLPAGEVYPLLRALDKQLGISVQPQPTAGTPIEELAIRTREYKCLKYAGITTVEQLAAMSDQQLLSIPGFGKTSLNEVRMAQRIDA